jgi:RNA polymerase sigma-70 factor (ECF subfamily)
MTEARTETDAAPDAELLGRCRAGDQVAWTLLVERYSRYVYAIVVRGFRLSDHEAEDAFQDIFLRVYERLGTLRDDEALRPWIAQVARRICIDRVAERGRAALPSDELEGEALEAASEGELAGIEEAMDVHEALAGLEPPCREMLDRFFARDEPYRVIADALGVPMGTVASRISRCLGKLRASLGEGRNPPSEPSGG